MPNFSFESKVRSVDLKLEINDISEESANRIIEYIQAEIAAADPFAKIADRLVERDVAKVEPLPEIKEDPETEEKTAVVLNGRTLTRRQRIVRGMAAWKPIQSILADATVNREGYEWRRASAKEFCEKWRDVKGLEDVRSVGSVLSGIADEGELKKWDKDAQHRYRTYRLPFPVVEDEPKKSASRSEEPPKPATVSARLREYRERSGLGTDEVSELIGYPESVYRIWEAGENVPSREGKAQLESLFGKHIFDGVQKPVIW